MKRKLLFAAMTLIAGAWALSANAQGTWTAPAVPGVDLSGTIPDGNVYMYNVEADAFVTKGMNWNTNAIAMRLKSGDTAADNRQAGKITVSGTTVKFSLNENSERGVGTDGGTNNVWADFDHNFDWNFAASTTISGAYTLENTSYVGNKLDVSWKYGGHLTIKEGYGNYDWAFITEANITGGAYAAYKARKDMYAVYQAIADNGKTADYATELSTANAVYTNTSATAADLRAATRTLLIAAAQGIKSEVPANALFTNPDMIGAWSASDWGANPAKDLGDLEVFHAKVTLTQTQNDVPNGLYRIVFHGLYRQDGSDAAPVVSAKTVTGNVVEMRTLSYDVNNNNGNTWTNNNGWIPDRMKSAAEALTHTNAVTTLENVLVNDNSLTINTTVSNSSQWFNFQGYEIYFQPVDLQAYIDAWKAALATAKATAATTETIAPSVLTALNTTISTYDESVVDQTNQDALVAAAEALVAANTLAQTSIASYAVIAAGFVPDDSEKGWVCTNTNEFRVNTWSNEGNPGNDPSGMVTPFIQNWVGKGSHLGEGKVYYRLEGLEPGEVYRVSALVRSYNEADATAPNGPNFYVNSDVANLTEVGTTFTYNGMSGIYGTQTAAATIGSDGILELGVIIAADRNYNWVAFKNVKIETFDAALAAAVAAVQAYDGKVPSAAYTPASADIAACQGTNYPTTAEQFETAISKLEQDAKTLEVLAEPYAAYLELKAYADALVAVDFEELEDGANQTLAEAISKADTDANTVTEPTAIAPIGAALKQAMTTYAAAADPTEGNQFDLTFMLTNPDVTKFWTGAWNVRPEGWYNDQTDGNFQVMANNDMGPGGEVFMEYWQDNPKTSGFVLYQKVTLPEGTYKMTGRVGLQQDVNGTNANMTFSANDTDGSQIAVGTLSDQSVEFTNTTEQEVKIGIKAHTGNQYRWIGINKIQLYKVPTETFTLDEGEWDYKYNTSGAGEVTLVRTINEGINAVVLPFSMTQDEVEEFFGTGAKVYIVKSYDAEKNHLAFTTQSGIQPNIPCLIKATKKGEEYTIAGRTVVAAESAHPVYTATNVTMTGNYEDEVTVAAGDWLVAKQKLRPSNGNATIYATRATVHLEGAIQGDVKSLNVTFDEEEATGIAIVENGQFQLYTGKAYDLNGREVKNLTKGMYIIDGKKVFIK